MLLLFVLLWAIFEPTECSLEISSSNPNIVEGSELLNITCTFRHQDQPDMDRLASLTLSKRNDLDSNFTELLTVNTFKPNHVEEIDRTFSGGSDGLALRKGPVSHLTAIYYNPTKNEAGEYRCESHGFDEFSRSIVDEKTLTMTLTPDSSNQGDTKQLEKRLEELELELDLAREEAPAKCQSAALNWFQVVHRLTQTTASGERDLYAVSEIFNSTSFYILLANGLSLDKIIETCNKYAGYLVEVNSEEELYFLDQNFIKTIGYRNIDFPHSYLTGASLPGLGSSFVFDTRHEDPVYTGHWADGDPSLDDPQKNRIVLILDYTTTDGRLLMTDKNPSDTGGLCEVSV